ncbi:MAG: hypothetical protein BRD50_01855 [Bacteroidetes bacterium SW_11_45_7]|nr:MAG: hypothetical protein BRD50_01855 [Bacteroidetes bacterium SW_11_45_7]
MVSRSVTTDRFRKAFAKLPSHVQEKARSTYRLWREDPQHPSLQFKQVHASEPIYSVRIGLGYRALGVLQNDRMIWFWIGSHESYNEMIKRL